MTRPGRQPRRADSEAGFILPGVVMFVVVLTILGFSLFALSGYESQFMSRSLDQADAFYAANGAIDRARFLLTSQPYPALLSRVSAGNLGPDIPYARALQEADSQGIVLPNKVVTIRVMAEKDSVRRMLEAKFVPVPQPYDNLFNMTATDRGLYLSPQGAAYARRQVQLVGTVWQTYHGLIPPNAHDYWDDIFGATGMASGSAIDTQFVSVPVAQVQTFLSPARLAAATPVNPDAQNRVYLQPGPGNIGFYKTLKSSGDWSLDLQGQDPTIHVDGIAVWMFDSGFRSQKTVHVIGDANDMLVLVAKETNDPLVTYGDTDQGFIFVRGFISANVPVIMVSDGYVAIDSEPNGGTVSSVPWLSVYAHFAYIVGPQPGAGANSTFYHVVGSLPQAEINLQTLLDYGYLPNANPNRNKLTYIPGTWQELPTP